MAVERLAGREVLILEDTGPLVGTEAEATDLIGQTYGSDIDMIAIPTTRLRPEFLDLSTKLAGLFFQKLQNYQLRLAIIGDLSAAIGESKALRDFVGETNRIGHHLFVGDRDTLAATLDKAN